MYEKSSIYVEDYNRTYTYKEFLMNLGIIREDTKKNENTSKDENTVKNNTITNENQNNNSNENTNTTVEEPKEEEKPNEEKPKEDEKKDEKPKEDDDNNSTPVENIWIKPTVTCTEFKANVYSANTNISISDPSRVIYKAITFAFYKDDQLAFRASSTSAGTLSVTKLLPNTKYKIVGTFQYRNKEGSLIENTILEQEIKTKGTDT